MRALSGESEETWRGLSGKKSKKCKKCKKKLLTRDKLHKEDFEDSILSSYKQP
jgi:hypothetical protein